MAKTRLYTTIYCTDCNKELKVRNDSIKTHKRRCQRCSSILKWQDNEYRQKCINSHIGYKIPENVKKNMSLVKIGIHPKNLLSIQQIHKKPTGMASLKHLYNSYKISAVKRSYCFELTIEDFKKLTLDNCIYCGCSPSLVRIPHSGVNGSYQYNGIDRVDNNVGYILSNCVPCCKNCNYAKRKMTIDEFKSWITNVFNTTIVGSRTEYAK